MKFVYGVNPPRRFLVIIIIDKYIISLSRIWNSEVNNIRHTQYKCDVCDVNTMTILSGAKSAPELHRRVHYF